MADELKLTTEYKGFTISWVPWNKTWEIALDGKPVKKGLASPDKAQEWIDAQGKRKYKRVDVLIRSGYEESLHYSPGIATSISEDGKDVWVTQGDRRGKEEIVNVYLGTPENRDIIDRIGEVQKKIGVLRGEEKTYRLSLKRFTPDMMQPE